MIKTIAVVNKKGGSGKTTLCHLLALGAVWNDKAAAILHTDDKEPQEINRPYSYFDCRNDRTLANQANAILDSGLEGLLIIDSGANREINDMWFSRHADLILIPLFLSPDDIKTSIAHMKKIMDAGHKAHYVILKEASLDKLGKRKAELLSRLDQELILTTVPQLGDSATLLDDDLDGFKTPPPKVNNASRALYDTIMATL